MQPVEVGAGRQFAAQDIAIEAGMALGRCESGLGRVEHHVPRMRWNYEVDGQRAEVDDVFNGMHRQTRPWPGVCVLVVQCMYASVDRRPVEEPVREVEM